MRPGQSTCGLLALPQKDLPQVTEWCTGIPVLVHWTVIAMFCMAAVGGGVCVCVCVCLCVCTFPSCGQNV